MPHHNRARLIDIVELDLDPTAEHVAGPDGRLNTQGPGKGKDHKIKDDEKPLEEEVAKEEVQEVVETVKKVSKTAKKTAAKN
jgi:hypothetical protein